MNKAPFFLFFLALAVWLADYAAKWEIAHTPVPAQVAVIDLDGLVKEAATLDPNDKAAMEKLTGKLREAAQLGSQGRRGARRQNRT